MAEQNGVWRTISGRRIFIAEGQSLTEAMRQSGKFKDMEEKKPARKMSDEQKAKLKKQAIYNKAKERYNDLMMSLGREHRTIGTYYSEDTENMTIKGMARECKEEHDTYYEWGHMNYDLKEVDRAAWQSEKDRLWRFWNKYKDVE